MRKIVHRLSIFLFLVLALTHIQQKEPTRALAEPEYGTWELANSPWPTMQNDFQRTGRSPLMGFVERPVTIWERQDGFPYAQLTIGMNNTIYVKTGSQTYTVDFNGNQDQTGLPGGDCSSSPVHMNNGYIFYSGGISWWAINSNGQVVWTIPHQAGCFSTLTTVRPDGLAYFGFGSGFGNAYLFGVQGSNGNVLWGGQETYGYRPAIGSDGAIYSVLYSGGFKALSADGDLLWTKTDLDYEGHPAIGDDGTIYTTTYEPNSGDVQLRALNDDGSIQWDYPLELRPCGFGLPGPTVGLDGTIYMGVGFQGDDNPEVYFYAINPDGTLKWRFVRQASANGLASPVCVPAVVDNQDNVYFCDTTDCHAFTNNGQRLWSIDGSAAVFSTLVIGDNGLIFIPTVDGVKAVVPSQGVAFLPITLTP